MAKTFRSVCTSGIYIAFLTTLFSNSCLAQDSEGSVLALNVYLDQGDLGKTLVVGYADEITGLDFLRPGDYIYENDSHQLYLLADLVSRVEDIWRLELPFSSYYDEFHVVVYLPGSAEVLQMGDSDMLDYLVYSHQDSGVVDVQGYGVSSPNIVVEYT
jgi:hypothetical protein